MSQRNACDVRCSTSHVARRTSNLFPRRFLAPWFLAILFLALASCTTVRGLRPNEGEIVAWYIEDLAHGNERRAGEIQLQEASEELLRLSRWLTGSTQAGKVLPPDMLAARMARWPTLRSLFRSGFAVLLIDGPERGLVAPCRDLSDADLALAAPIIDAENRDRRTIDVVVAETARLDMSTAHRYTDQVIAARCALDQAAGATPWKTETTQENATP